MIKNKVGFSAHRPNITRNGRLTWIDIQAGFDRNIVSFRLFDTCTKRSRGDCVYTHSHDAFWRLV